MAGLPGVNVALPAKASQTVATGLVRGASSVATSLVTSGFFIGLCTAAYFLVRKAITAYRHSKLVNEVGASTQDGLAIGYAQRLYTAMISGYEVWNDWFGDGTDEDAMYQVAREMFAHKVPFALVSSKYKVLYNRELLDDVTQELDSSQVSVFQRAMSTGALNGLGALSTGRELLFTTSATPVFDAQLRELGQLPALMKLGAHVQTLQSPQGQVWLGFAHGQQLRFVSALAVSSLSY
jgi:hypothetical protein